MTKVLYPGSFDPITKGHMNIVKQASDLFDEVIIAVLQNPLKKSGLFTLEERIEIVKELYKNVEIKYLNEPPKAKLVTNNDIVNNMDFNGYNLYDYQLDGVQYGLNHHNFLLLDEQRIRKNFTNNNTCKI